MGKVQSKVGEYAILAATGLAAIYILTLKPDAGKETIIEKVVSNVGSNIASRSGEFVQGAAFGAIDTSRNIVGGIDENKNPVGLIGGFVAPTWFLGSDIAAPGSKKGVTVSPPKSTVQDVYALGGSSQDYTDYSRAYLKKQNATTQIVKGNIFGSTTETVRTGAGFVLPPEQAIAFKDPVGDRQFQEYLTTAKKVPKKKKLFRR